MNATIRRLVLTATLAVGLPALADDAPKPPPKSGVLNPDADSPLHPAGQMVGKLSKSADGAVSIKVPHLERRSTGRRASMREVDKDHDFILAADAKVRWQNLPKKADGKPYSDKEYQALRDPPGTPGYKADKSDLKPGQTVKLYLSKAGKDDKPVVTTVVIVADAAKQSDADKPKKKD